jgi:hypothetical protein
VAVAGWQGDSDRVAVVWQGGSDRVAVVWQGGSGRWVAVVCGRVAVAGW